jgi:hypothetical protein
MNAGGAGLFTKQHKYRAQRTYCANGHWHPSKAEAKRCDELHILEKAGEITHLTFQPKFPVHINGIKVFTYIADFSYFPLKPEKGGRIIEDVKGVLTAIYKLKKKAVEAYYPGVKIVEVR